MGKPSPPGPSGDSMSLHTQPSYRDEPARYTDDDAPELQIDDLPPLYDDIAGPSSETTPLHPFDPRGPPPGALIPSYSTDSGTGVVNYLDSRLDNDPKLLEQHIYHWSDKPPRQFIRLHGQHRQTEENRDGKKETKWVTDFDVQVEITPYLFSDAANWVSPRYVYCLGDDVKARRGTVFATTERHRRTSLEGGPSFGKPTLAEWCHRYCASHAGLKCFSVQRQVVGLDQARIKEKFMGLIRATNYRGDFDVTFPVKEEYVHVYNDCKTNRWRATPWIWWLCALTLTFIFTWPYLFFRTKRWEVVKVRWPFRDEEGRYTSISEDQLYNMWARAVYRAVLERQQRVLDQGDLTAAESAPLNFNNGLVNDTMGIFRAGVDAMNVMNRHMGWGGDS